MTPPVGCYIRIAARSGLAINHKLQVGAGVIDPNYTREIKVILFNHSSKTFSIQTGDKIAQVVIEQAAIPEIQILKYLKATKRGNLGFRSTNLAKTSKTKSLRKDTMPEDTKFPEDNLIILSKIMERPKGCSFIGSKPSVVTAALGHIHGPKTEIIIDSGSVMILEVFRHFLQVIWYFYLFSPSFYEGSED